MDALDRKLNDVFPGRVVRKDLLHRVKKGTNVPSFVLEFLLAKYCASDDADEIQAGIEAVFETLRKHYVRPDESNKAQSMVQQKERHKYIDKVHVRYVEREKRHWAAMENFGSQRIALPDRFYKDNDRLLEGGIWAEAVVCHNDVDEDDYAFYLEDLKPIQLSRFDLDAYIEGRKAFTRDEWLDLLVRSIGLEPSRCELRLKLHYLSRIIPFVESNFNFIELGPRGTGKSYAYSEFSPYSTLVSGGQASAANLFYNNARRKVGLVGFWDIVAFDEVAGIRVKDPHTIDILKDYMANGRFSRAMAEVIANASLAFVGNIDYAVDQLVNSHQFDLFISLPKQFDLAVMDRLHFFLPGWEIPKTDSQSLTSNYGFISDYLAEAFHHLARTNVYNWVNENCRFGDSLQGRDEVGIKKSLCGLIKLLHPGDLRPTPEELDQYMAFAIEGRRRVKEQMNKRKPDDEFALINLSYFNSAGEDIVVYCPESKNAPATQKPKRQKLPGLPEMESDAGDSKSGDSEKQAAERPTQAEVAEEGETEQVSTASDLPPATPPALEPPDRGSAAELAVTEQHYRIQYGAIGYTYDSMFGKYFWNAKTVKVEDPYIRIPHQIANFVRLCELAVKTGTIREVHLLTSFEDSEQKKDVLEKLAMLQESLLQHDIELKIKVSPTIHDRQIELDNGWIIKIGRGLNFYQAPDNWYSIGVNDYELRPCMETMVDIYRKK